MLILSGFSLAAENVRNKRKINVSTKLSLYIYIYLYVYFVINNNGLNLKGNLLDDFLNSSEEKNTHPGTTVKKSRANCILCQKVSDEGNICTSRSP